MQGLPSKYTLDELLDRVREFHGKEIEPTPTPTWRTNAMKVTPIGSNMTEVLKDDGAIVLVSYETPVAAFIPGEGILFQREDKASSRTTGRHLNKWASQFSPSVAKTETNEKTIYDILAR